MASSTTIGRRNFMFGALALSTAAVAEMGSAATRSPAAAAAVTTVTAWRLKATNWSSPRGHPLRTHCKCSACVRHAHNKIFATLSDAEDPHLRAHPGCLCEPEQIELPSSVWKTVFGTGAVVDKRDPDVAATLAAGGTTGPHVSSRATTAGANTSRSSVPTVPSAMPGTVPPVVPGSIPGTVPSTVPPSSARSSPQSEVLGASAVASRSHPRELYWLGIPIAGVATALGFLIWWRRRGAQQEPETVASDPTR